MPDWINNPRYQRVIQKLQGLPSWQRAIFTSVSAELEKIHVICLISTKVTVKTFFPGRFFFVPFTKNIHGKIFDLIDGPVNKVGIIVSCNSA